MRKPLVLALCLFGVLSPPAKASSVVGKWAYIMKVHQGIEFPEPPHATLRLRFEFLASGDSRLYWWHVGQGDHCERHGRYHLEGDQLVDRVVWVDPKNSYACSQDPDMQDGRITRTPFSFRGENLSLRLPFGGSEIFYIWKKITVEEE